MRNAIGYAHELEGMNLKRRRIDSDTMDRAMAMLDETFRSGKIFFTGSSRSRVAPGCYRNRCIPIWSTNIAGRTIMLSSVDGQIKGSARSIKGFNIYEALKECEDLLVQFGGHEYAAGLTLNEEDLEAFRERFNKLAVRNLSEDDLVPELEIDSELEPFTILTAGSGKYCDNLNPMVR